MKPYRVYLALTFLVFASLACNALAGRRNNNSALPTETSGDQAEQATAVSTSANEGSNGNNTTVKTDFPMLDDAFNITDTGDGSILYYTKKSLEDVMAFYREKYSGRDYTEREILTTVSGGTFSMVFDGDPSGKAVVIQSVDLGDGSRTVAIRLEAVP